MNNSYLRHDRPWEVNMKQKFSKYIIIGILCVLPISLFAQINYHYPIIFVHGLVGGDNTFSGSMEYLRDEQNFGEINVFDVILNADNDSESALMSEDVKWESFVYDEDVILLGRRNYSESFDEYIYSWENSNLFAINFMEERIQGAYGTFNDYFDQSNEAAIFKQGYALGKMIQEVLDFTGAEKVILVGHSMGGLAIREYLQRTDEQGVHTNWINPLTPDGHKVARVVTFGTPHLGSNTSPDPTKSSIPNANGNSEANRDLLWEYDSYTNCSENINQGIYMFGGYEFCIQSEDGILENSTFDNVDINCDGDEDDLIVGINEGFYSQKDNPNMPLPNNIRYTWLTSIWIGWDIGLIGDGAVDINRQWLYDENQNPVPLGLADTCLTDVFHTNEPDDYRTLVRGLDEPQQFNLAYQLNPQDSLNGHITYQSNYNPIDIDTYVIPVEASHSVSIYYDNSNSLIDSMMIYDKNLNLIQEEAIAPNWDSLYIQANLFDSDTLYLQVKGTADANSWQYTYKISSETHLWTTQPTVNQKPIASLYPNPCQNKINIQLNEGISKASLRVLDVNGRCIYEENIKNNLKLNTSRFKAGTYYFNIKTKQIEQSFKVQKQNGLK